MHTMPERMKTVPEQMEIVAESVPAGIARRGPRHNGRCDQDASGRSRKRAASGKGFHITHDMTRSLHTCRLSEAPFQIVLVCAA